MGKTIIQDGKIFHETFTGSYVPDTTIFGNPKMNLDIWGNPIIKTDLFGNQIVDVDMFGNPIIPVEYPNLSSIGSRKGTVSGSVDGSGVFFSLLPYILLAGGLYSVFATMAGSVIFIFSAIGILATGIGAAIADKTKGLNISNGIQKPFYIISTGWVFGILTFWIHFFFNMNFDVAATNYLTKASLMSTVFPQMGLFACIGVVLATILTYLFRSDMYSVRQSSSRRCNRDCVFDMVISSVLPPIMAVAISLAWFIVAIIADLFWKRNVLDKQATVMAIVFVILGIGIVVNRFKNMVKS